MRCYSAMLLRDADPQPAEALAFVLDLHDLDPAYLRSRRDVRTAVGLLVEADDVHDPDLLDLRRYQVRRRADDVGNRERVVAGQNAYVDPPSCRDLGVTGVLERVPE